MNVDSIKYPHADRPHIPSQEEAGTEAASPALQSGKDKTEYPKNPIVHRGQDPELFWLGKYGEDDADDRLRVDIRSLYRTEHIAPEKLIKNLHRVVESESKQPDLFSFNQLFGNALDRDELSKVGDYYVHRDGWTNRLIQGDSLLVMASLLEREGMAGQVQMIYIDPPYGIKYGSNWQMRLNDRTVTDGKDEHVSGEPEVIKAYRDTWELGIHSYLSYLRDRLLIARELLHNTGSVFVQISDENVHLVRCLLDEVFGSENFVVTIVFQKKAYQDAGTLAAVNDFILWYAKDKDSPLKYRPLYEHITFEGDVGKYRKIMAPDGTIESSTNYNEAEINALIEKGWRLFRDDYPLVSQDPPSEPQPYKFEGKVYEPPRGRHWSVSYPDGLDRLAEKGRLRATDNRLYAISYWDDSPLVPLNNVWTKMKGAANMKYVVQTTEKVIQRCLLMATDPGDLVLDPTCGSGTTPYVAEQWGRRCIAIDSSRIAISISKQRLLTAIYPYYILHDEAGRDVLQGFKYSSVQRVTLGSISNNEPPEEEFLYDQPKEDKGRLRVTGPFTVETLQAFEPVAPGELDAEQPDDEDAGRFEERIFEHLKSAGIKNGIREEQAVFSRVDRLADAYLHAEGYYTGADGMERKAYMHIGPRFGSASRQAVNEAIKAARRKGGCDWLVILGFAFETNIENTTQTTSLGTFEVTKVRMHDDLLQEGLLKKDKKAASFVTIGEPDVTLHREGDAVTVEVRGLDIYDPIKDQVKARSVADISYWLVDDNYDGSNFVVRQVFFCGGPKDAFDKWKKGLDDAAKRDAKKRAEKTLKIEIDDEAFDRLYGFRSHPITLRGGHQQIAVRVISQFGEESTKVLDVGP